MDRLASFYKLDFFTKIDSSFTRTTAAGGTVSLLTYLFIILLLLSELTSYLNPDIVFHYMVDREFDRKLNISVDITVATPCSGIGADILDSTNKQSLYTYGDLDEKATYFELTPKQQERWNRIRHFNDFFRNQHHNIHQLIWKPNALRQPVIDTKFEELQVSNGKNPDSCQFRGTLTVNKVSGNLHISAGKYLPLPMGHAHVSLMDNENAINFSHRIERLSFGDQTPSRFQFPISALDGVEKVTKANSQVYQYYLKVVLTNVEAGGHKTEFYQYSVTERELVANHAAGVHGIPGIYFKYDIEGLKVNVREESIPLWQFLVRLCAIVGGILAISGLINQIATYIVDIVTGKYIADIDIH